MVVVLKCEWSLTISVVPSLSQISVYPNETEKVENPNSRRVRRREAFRVQREKKRELRDEGYYGEPLISIAEVTESGDDETAVC